MWAEVDTGKRLRRTFIVQVEGYYPDDQGFYKYGTPRRSLSTQCFIYDNDQSAREKPGNESDLTRQFFRDKGYEWESQLVMSRFARIVDDSRKHEIIFFYYENLKNYTTKRAADFPEEGKTAEQKLILDAVDADSRAAFTIAHWALKYPKRASGVGSSFVPA
jgi:hypothetical protein